jgi:hypothetical protein
MFLFTAGWFVRGRISEGRAKIEQQKFNDKLDAVVAGVQVAPRFKTSLTNYFRSTPPPPNILFASTITNIFSPPSHFDATTMTSTLRLHQQRFNPAIPSHVCLQSSSYASPLGLRASSGAWYACPALYCLVMNNLV